jgi:hypothetical protein
MYIYVYVLRDNEPVTAQATSHKMKRKGACSWY